MSSTAAKLGDQGFDMKAHFERAASTYERQAGGLTRVVSDHLISISKPPLSNASVVLDNATGPGITCTQILNTLPESSWPKELYATDLSEAMIGQVKAKGLSRIQAEVMDCTELKFPDGKFSHIYLAFIIFALGDQGSTKAASELYRTLKPGGSAYVTSWKRLGWVDPVTRALKTIRPDSEPWTGPVDKAWFEGSRLKECLVSGGFAEDKVEVHSLDSKAPPEFWDGTKEFVKSGILNPTLGDWSEDEKKRVYQAIEDEMMKEKATGMQVDFPCWVAVATK